MNIVLRGVLLGTALLLTRPAVHAATPDATVACPNLNHVVGDWVVACTPKRRRSAPRVLPERHRAVDIATASADK